MPEANNPSKPQRTTRRRVLAGASGLLAVAAGGGLADALFVEPHWIKVSRPVFRIPGLGEAWEGARLAVLADIHLGRLQKPDYLRRIVHLANRARPDVTVIAGDMISRRSGITEAARSALAELEAPEGVFAVLGNHDYDAPAGEVADMLAGAGVEVLVNAHRVVEREGQPLCIAGVDDLMRGSPDLATALRGAPADGPRILLAHNPDYAERMPAGPRVDFMLSGHTHGGQLCLPAGIPLFAAVRHRKYARGLVRGPQCDVYVSRGLGMVFVPMRFNCRPELPIGTLRRASGEERGHEHDV